MEHSLEGQKWPMSCDGDFQQFAELLKWLELLHSGPHQDLENFLRLFSSGLIIPP